MTMSGETEQQPSGWTVDTALQFMQRQHDDLRDQLNERYETQTKATDAAYVAQTTAMQTAFIAADKAVQAALESAKEAVAKSEASSEKRFESVNEFRGQLADQAATLMSRSEAEVRFQSLLERFDAERLVNNERYVVLASRMDQNTGKDSGQAAQQARLYAMWAAFGGLVIIILGIVTVLISLR
jgi:arginine utilization protein RocB